VEITKSSREGDFKILIAFLHRLDYFHAVKLWQPLPSGRLHGAIIMADTESVLYTGAFTRLLVLPASNGVQVSLQTKLIEQGDS
jgi:hypothetical protein